MNDTTPGRSDLQSEESGVVFVVGLAFVIAGMTTWLVSGAAQFFAYAGLALVLAANIMR